MDDFYFDYPVGRVARNFEPESIATVQDDDPEWVHVLVGDRNSGVQFWVDVSNGYWEFNQTAFDRMNTRDRFMQEFFGSEDVILAVDTLMDRVMEGV